MSRIGRQIIAIPDGVTVIVTGQEVKATGSKGELSLVLPEKVKAKIEGSIIKLERVSDDKEARSLHGLNKVLVNNLVIGVSQGFSKSLEFKGIGYRVAISGSQMTINAGYSHPVELTIPEGLAVTTQKTTIVVAGIDKYRVGEFAAKLRSVRKPEVYKGKGFRYSDEHIKIKPGKTAAKG